jgi:hypothetical protein
VTFRYENVPALAATVPSDRLPDLLEIAGEQSVWKDRLVPVPQADDESRGLAERGKSSASLDESEAASLNDQQVTEVASSHVDDFTASNNLTGASVLHASGMQAAGVVVAVIDSGTANAPKVTPLSGSVIGGESLVADEKAPSATSTLNNPHGTQVASMIAAHGSFVFSTRSSFVQSLLIHSADSVIPCPKPPLNVPCDPKTSSVVPMIGTAPGAKIYAVKVVKSDEGGAPESRLVAAMDRVLTLRRNFNDGIPSAHVRGAGSENDPFVYDSLNVQVVNMSIGGPTLFAGQGLADELTVKMLLAGIVVVASAGNNGPAAMTGGSPGTGRGALTVGAASSYVNERVLRDVQFGVFAGPPLFSSGLLYRPVAENQMWSGSSRGPTADGRWSPHVVANGFATFVQDALGKSSLVTGTSFAAPTVAGAAALLVESAPWASAVQIRNALIESADPAKLGDGSGLIDQGRGWVNIPAAQALLNGDEVSSRLARGLGSERVTANIRALGIHPVRFIDDRFTTEIQSLKPGQVAHFFVPTPRDLAKVTIKIRNITAEAPQPNLLLCDNLMVHVVDAPTSLAQPRVDNTFVGPQKDKNGEFCNNADAKFVVKHPQHGLMRIAIAGSFSNVGNVSAELEIERSREIRVRPTETGRVRQGDLIPIQVDVPAGTKKLTFDLSWESDWSRYPTADLDLLLVDPKLRVNSKDGATLSSPERITIENPTAGVWTAQVSAITIHRESHNDDDDNDREWHGHDHETCMEEFALRVLADGQPLPKLKSPRPPRRRRH